MEYVVGGLALFFVLAMVLTVLAVVKTVRTVKRGAERTRRQVRRVMRDAAVRARTAQPGPVGELARMRIDLRSSLDTTRQVLEAGVRTDPSLGEALTLLEQLYGHARQLDGELGTLMDREPDRARVAAQLPDARRRMAGIKRSADSLRWAAQDRARAYTEEGRAALEEQIVIETGALRHWQDHGEPPGLALDTGSTGVAGPGVPEVDAGMPPGSRRPPPAVPAEEAKRQSVEDGS